MSLSIRYSLQWPKSESEESELTNTLVLTSPIGLYVDIRPFKDLSKGFDWYFAGLEIPIKNTSKIEFNHDFFDSAYIDYYFNNKLSSKGFITTSDLGDFKDSDDPVEKQNGIRLETGDLLNLKTGNVEPYIEKWITCDPNLPDLKYVGDNYQTPKNLRCLVLDTSKGGITDNENNFDICIGRLVVLGNWVQSLIWNKAIKMSKQESVGIQRYFKGDKPLVSYGGQINKFPLLKDLEIKKDLKVGDIAITVDGVEWIVKEISNW